MIHSRSTRMPSARRYILAAIAVAGLSVSGCRTGTEADNWTWTAVFADIQVTDQSDVPVPGAAVDFRVFTGACAAPATAATLSFATSDAVGRVKMRVNSLPQGEFLACVTLTIRPPSGLRDTLVSDLIATFRQPSTGALDTLRRQVRLSR